MIVSSLVAWVYCMHTHMLIISITYCLFTLQYYTRLQVMIMNIAINPK